MSKSVRWQIPFASNITQTKYRIDIYDSGTYSTPIVLTAGTNPLSTEEDNNEDFFTPLRKQTGKIRICTKIEPQTALPSGGMLDIADLLPATNVDKPVRVIRINDSTTPATETIEWQGFLSCEVFSQNYTGIPDNVDINIISVLEAMDSVEVELKSDMAFRKVIAHIAYAMQSIATKSDMSDLWGNVYISDYAFTAITSEYFYSNVYFSIDEVVNGDKITAEIHSISCKKILEQIAQFFGCCWRENGKDLYLETISSQPAFYYLPYSSIVTYYLNSNTGTSWSSRSRQLQPMSGLTWRGTGHKRNMRQGARRVTVKANLKAFDVSIDMKDCPVGSLVENNSSKQANWGEVYCNTNETFYNLAEHKHYVVQQRTYEDDNDGGAFKAEAYVNNNPFTTDIGYDYTIPFEGTFNNFLLKWNSMIINQQVDSTYYRATSYMGYMRLRENGEDKELKSGLMVCGMPRLLRVSDSVTMTNQIFLDTQSQADIQYYVFKQDSGLDFRGATGKMTFEIDIMATCMAATSGHMCTLYKESFASFAQNPSVRFAIRVGNKWVRYYNGAYSFVNYFQTFDLTVDNNGNGKIEVPISSIIMGQCSVYVYPVIGGTAAEWQRSALCAFISSMKLGYEPTEELLNDNSENTYMAETGKEFKDEESIDLDIASDVNNLKQATMLWHSEQTAASNISIGGRWSRPEVDLLQRAVAYYTAIRQKVELECAHIGLYALPYIYMSGITDNKIYLPIAESRDWREEVSKLTCIETADTMPQE